MNIVKLQNDLKDLSDRQLLDTMQAGSAPQYLVLSEMQRRKKMRDEVASQPQQQSSVAEDIMTPPQPMPQQAPQGIAAMPQVPQVAMASGGIVGFARGGYAKGEKQACWSNPETGAEMCPPDKPKTVGKKFAEGKSVSGYSLEAQALMNMLDEEGVGQNFSPDDIQTIVDRYSQMGFAQPIKGEYGSDEYRASIRNKYKPMFGEQPSSTGKTDALIRDDIPSVNGDGAQAKSAVPKVSAEPKSALPTQSAAEGIAALGEARGSLGYGELAPTVKPHGMSLVPPLSEEDKARIMSDNERQQMAPRLPREVRGEEDYIKSLEAAKYGDPGLPSEGVGALLAKQDTDALKGYDNPAVPAGKPAAPAKDEQPIPSYLLPSLDPARTAKPSVSAGVPQGADEYAGITDAVSPGLSAEEVMARLGEGRMELQGNESTPTRILQARADANRPKAPTSAGIPTGGDEYAGIDQAPVGSDLGVSSLYNALFDPTERKAAHMARMERLQMTGDLPYDPGFDEGDTGYADTRTPYVSEPDELEGYDNPAIPEKNAVGLPEATRKVEAEKKAAAQARVDDINAQVANATGNINDFATTETISDPRKAFYEAYKGEQLGGSKESSKTDRMNEFLMRAGLGMASSASKGGDFLGSVAAGGMEGLKGLSELRKAEREAEESAMLERGRMSRAEISDAATRYAADVGLKAKQIESIRKTIDDIRDEIIDDPTMSDALKQQKMLEIKRLGKMMQDLMGTSRKDASALSNIR